LIFACGINEHPYSGGLGFYRQRRVKRGARSTPIVVGKPDYLNHIRSLLMGRIDQAEADFLTFYPLKQGEK